VDKIKTILIIDDDINLNLTLYGALNNEYRVLTAKTAQSGLKKIQIFTINLIILDLNLPDAYGASVVKQVRQRGINIPILILSGEGDLNSKVDLLDLGANDYVTKPFSLAELRARIKNLLRQNVAYPKRAVLVSRSLVLDPRRRQAIREGKVIDLRQKEFAILECLMRHAGTIVSRNTLKEVVWPDRHSLKTNAIDVHINSLRSKIDKGHSQPLIKTVHGLGYLLDIINPKVGV